MVERVLQSTPIKPSPSELAEYGGSFELIQRFMEAPVKIALQKDGGLTEISRAIYNERLGIGVPPLPPDERDLVSVSPDGFFGYLFVRNKDICNLVASGAVDQAIVGLDRLVEDQDYDKVEMVATFREYGLWSIVLATANGSGIVSLDQIQRVASKYPVITGEYFRTLGMPNVEVVSVNGATEIFPYLQYQEGPIDAIVDLTVSGRSLKQNNLVVWDPPIGEVYPVLIRAKEGVK